MYEEEFLKGQLQNDTELIGLGLFCNTFLENTVYIYRKDLCIIQNIEMLLLEYLQTSSKSSIY